MRVVLVSTHVDQTSGYSKVAYNLLRQLATLRPKIKLFHFGFQRHPGRANLRKVPEGVVAYDAAAAEDPKEDGFGYNKIQEYLDMVTPDLVIFYNDPLVISRFLEVLKYDNTKAPYKVWAYIDQVYYGVYPQLIQTIDKAAEHVYLFSDTWRKTYLSYTNGEPKAIAKVMGHAADPEIFRSLPDRGSVRQQLRVPDEAIVFFNGNRNSDRKRLDLTIQGFVGLLAKNPEKPYYLVIATGMDPRSGAFYDIQRVFLTELNVAKLELSVMDRLIVIDTSKNLYSDEAINQLYNACDIGVNTSNGEGFGLCQLEHLQAGAPQVFTDVGSYDFLDETCSVKIPAPLREYTFMGQPLGTFSQNTVPELVTAALEKAATNLSTLREGIAKKVFPTWAETCDEFLEDILKRTETQ